MKICFISTMPANRWGGSEDLWAATARYALQQKHEVLLSLPFSAETIHQELTALKNEGAMLHLRKERDESMLIDKALYKLKRTLKGMAPVPAFYYDFLNAIKSFDPDLICINQGGVFNVVENYEVVWLTKNINKPFFLIGHSNLEHKVYPYPYLQRIREIYRAARKVYFISNRNLEVAKRQLASEDFKHYQYIKNPCKLVQKEVVDYPDGSTVNFAIVGRLQCRNKGHDILFQVLSADHWKKRNWVLNIYGLGDDLKYLEELASYFGIIGNLKFQGWVGNVREIWKKNHILLMPSIEEGTPLTLVEAMACGRTAVVTDVGDNAALIIEGETGFVAEAPTVKLVHAALERAWDKKSEWKQLGIKAHTFIEGFIDPEPGKHLLENMIAAIQ